MKSKNIFILMFLFVFLVSFTYSVDYDYNNYIVKCNIPAKFFKQSFTCLNDNCSYKFENQGEVLVSTSLNDSNYVFKNFFRLEDIDYNLDLIDNICEDSISDSTIEMISNELSLQKKIYVDDELVIFPIQEDYLKTFNVKESKYNLNFKNCYDIDSENFDGWMFETREFRDYCYLDDLNETQISQRKFFVYLVKNPSSYIFYYFVLFMIFSFSLLILHRFKIDLYRKGILKRFFRIDRTKLRVFGILFLPFMYVWGIFINFIFYEFYVVIFGLKEILGFIGVLVLYYFSLVIVYHFGKGD
ncbi:MAG: hypothetical protein PF569_10225 [Candidatus Woesearchaeota archaeon]|nr:hypothetical protein [Candidatus Woesearchaeota archaeon]